jgi:hypothetical protein
MSVFFASSVDHHVMYLLLHVLVEVLKLPIGEFDNRHSYLLSTKYWDLVWKKGAISGDLVGVRTRL